MKGLDVGCDVVFVWRGCNRVDATVLVTNSLSMELTKVLVMVVRGSTLKVVRSIRACRVSNSNLKTPDARTVIPYSPSHVKKDQRCVLTDDGRALGP